MAVDTRAELRRITALSRILLPILYLTMASIAAVLVTVPYLTLTSPTSTGAPLLDRGPIQVSPAQITGGELTYDDKILVLGTVVLSAPYFLAILWLAAQLVRSVKRNELFTARSARYAKLIAWLYLAGVVLSLIGHAARAWTPEGFDISFNPYFFSRELIVVGVLWLFVWVHEIGVKLRLDSDMTI